MTFLDGIAPWEYVCAAFVLIVAATMFARALVKR